MSKILSNAYKERAWQYMSKHLCERLKVASPIGGVLDKSANAQGKVWSKEDGSMIPNIIEDYWADRYPQFWGAVGHTPTSYHKSIRLDFRVDGVKRGLIPPVDLISASDVQGDGASFDLCLKNPNGGLPIPVSVKLKKFWCSGDDRVSLHRASDMGYMDMVLNCYQKHSGLVMFVYKHTMYCVNMSKLMSTLACKSTSDKVSFYTQGVKKPTQPIYSFWFNQKGNKYLDLSFKPSLLLSWRGRKNQTKPQKQATHTKAVWKWITEHKMGFKVRYLTLTEKGLMKRVKAIL